MAGQVSRAGGPTAGWLHYQRVITLLETARPGSKRVPTRAPRSHGRCFDRVKAMKTLSLLRKKRCKEKAKQLRAQI